MKVFLTIITVFLILFLVVTMGIFMPRLNKSVMLRRHLSSTPSVVQSNGTDTSSNEGLSPENRQISIYLVALGDEGASGEKIGCGDSLVAVKREIPNTSAVLQGALNELLSLKDKYYGESGLYTALASSSLQIDRIQMKDDTATIYLSGNLSLGGICDNPRVEDQLNATALQFPTVKTANFYLNNKPLQEALSQK